MVEEYEKPKIPPFAWLEEVEGCYENPPEGFQPFSPECPSLIDIRKMFAGGRAVVVTPYDDQVCSGDKGRFQILTGFAGQVCEAIYVGNTVGRDDAVTAKHGVSLHTGESEPDCIYGDPSVRGGPNGDKGIAIRDRGQWYVVKLGGTVSAVRTLRAIASAIGGNTAPITDGATPEYLTYKPWAFKQDVLDVDFSFPDVEDWTDYDLEEGFAHGDFLRNDALPPGFFWSRLLRDQRLGSRIWDAGQLSFSEIGGTTPVLQAAYVEPGSADTLTLVFNAEVWLNVDLEALDVPSFITFETTSATALTATPSLPSKDVFKLTVTLSREIEFEEEVEVTVEELLVFSEEPEPPESSGDSGNRGNPNSTEQDYVLYNDVRGAYILCFNYSQEANIYLGDVVETGQVENVADESESIRRVALCTTSSRINRPVLNAVLKSDLQYIDGPEALPSVTSWSTHDMSRSWVESSGVTSLPTGLAWAKVQAPDGTEAQAEFGKKMGSADRDAYYLVFMDTLEDQTLASGSPGLLHVSSLVLHPDDIVPPVGEDPDVREVYRFVPVGSSSPPNLYEVVAGNVVTYYENNAGVLWQDTDLEWEVLENDFFLDGTVWINAVTSLPYTPDGVLEDEVELTDGFAVARDLESNSLVFIFHGPGFTDFDRLAGDVVYCPRVLEVPIDEPFGGSVEPEFTVQVRIVMGMRSSP